MNEVTLVTGATGCLGAALTRALLDDGETVAALVEPGGAVMSAPRLEIRYGDVTDPGSLAAAMKGVGRVYHLAGVVVPLDSMADRMWQVNTLGSYNIARAAVDAGVQRLVHVSSIAAIGYPPDGVVADETFDVRDSVTDNAYATTKRSAERLVLDLSAADGLDTVVVNPSAVFAPGGDPRWAWSRMVGAARRGLLRAMPVGGTAVCAVRDFVDGTRKAMRQGQAGRRYILNTANLTYREIGDRLLTAVGRPGSVRTLPSRALRPVARFNAGFARLSRDPMRSSLLVPENVELLTRQLYYDQGRAVSELGMTQTPLDAMFGDLIGPTPARGVR
ncbi:NAD-dependent epimerase/dehydratase family protein [Nocardia sp. NBC_00881]|uniref:NAD-dependent epimerase/dehydratase family protein n=1 Tax=Nocardia sp. NBC_00881 TaxID=2975995 RepID=UPI00386E19A6|nr:NAD-dependent epimerase/dehydratase family protein [Nocardia sp. NBC_00881]